MPKAFFLGGSTGAGAGAGLTGAATGAGAGAAAGDGERPMRSRMPLTALDMPFLTCLTLMPLRPICSRHTYTGTHTHKGT